jgi:Ca-activated chloride channel family protein
MPTADLETTIYRPPALVAVDGRAFPLRSAKLTARAEGGLALSRLEQTFANPYDQALEVVYTMPLPAEGAVVGYTVRIGGRTIRGVVEPRERAEVAFRQALAEGRTAGLLEQDRDDTFQQRLGNIPPGTQVEVEIQVSQRLGTLAGTSSLGAQWEYRFPTVVGVRYEGAPGRVPDAERLDVNRDADGGIPTRLELDVTVADPAASNITSPSHSILCETGDEGARVRFGEGERLDRDLVLRWPASTYESTARLLIGGGLEGDDGRYGLITLTPPRDPRTTWNRDLTVLIDASGSMSGQPIEYAKEVVRELLQSLGPQDQFELLAFSNEVVRLTKNMTKATPDALRRAQDALRKLSAGGGTEMADAILKALEVPSGPGSQRQVVLVTDGQIGFEEQVLAAIIRTVYVCRVHVVGIGSAPNRTLTAGVARAGRGVELLVSDSVTAREAARRLCAATAQPVLTDVSIHGTALLRVATTRTRDVFTGQPLLAAVELHVGGGELQVSGRRAGSLELWVQSIAVPPVGTPAADAPLTPLPIGAIFGRERIADLELARAAGYAAAESIDAEIEALGMHHRIVSRRTSLVAIAEEPSVDPEAPRRIERLAAELPAGVSAQGSGLLAPAMAMRPMFETAQYQLRAGDRTRTTLYSIGTMRQPQALPSGPSRERGLREYFEGQPRRGERLRELIEQIHRDLRAAPSVTRDRGPSIRTAALAVVSMAGDERLALDVLKPWLISPKSSENLRNLYVKVYAFWGRIWLIAERIPQVPEDGLLTEEVRLWADQLMRDRMTLADLINQLTALVKAELPEAN